MTSQAPRNPALRAALSAYAESALGLLGDYVAAGDGVPDTEVEVWVRHGPALLRERRTVPQWRDALAGVRASLRALPEHTACMQALQRDPLIAGQLGTTVAVGLVARRLRADDLLDEFLARLAEGQGAFHLDAAAFARSYAALESSLYEPTVTLEAIAPLVGFHSGASPIVLGEELRIEALSDIDLADALRAGVLQAPEGQLLDAPRYALKAVVRAPKLVAATGEPQVPPTQAAQDRIEEGLRALAAFRDGRLRRPGTVFRSPHWLLRDALATAPGDAGVRPGRYALTAPDAGALTAFWRALQQPGARQRRSLQVALRRFHEASQRARPEDRLIDLLIVAEALALNVPFDSSDPREMVYRLALRTGSSMAEQRARREFDRHIRLAYQVRNDVVNGAPPRLPEGVTLDAFLATTEDLLRQALHRAIALSTAPSQRPLSN